MSSHDTSVHTCLTHALAFCPSLFTIPPTLYSLFGFAHASSWCCLVMLRLLLALPFCAFACTLLQWLPIAARQQHSYCYFYCTTAGAAAATGAAAAAASTTPLPPPPPPLPPRPRVVVVVEVEVEVVVVVVVVVV